MNTVVSTAAIAGTISRARGKRALRRSATMLQSERADAADQHDDGRLEARLIRREAVVAVEVARQPGLDRRNHEQIQSGADAGDERGARPEQLGDHGARRHARLRPSRSAATGSATVL